MNRTFKYDVAISVAEEDKPVADLIAAELKKRRVRYYYYVENKAESWGRHIIDLTIDTYGRQARFVLMITSAVFVHKYWSNLEKLIALAKTREGLPHILQLRLDDTSIDGISKHVVYQDWKNNPAEIADMLKEKIRVQKRIVHRKRGFMTAGIGSTLAMTLSLYGFLTPGIRRQVFPLHPIEQRLVAGPGIDSFYISNTEVTIGEYRKYCDSSRQQFPAQSPGVKDNAPVSNVTWNEAMAFCKSRGGRLPTEKEWEYAAGAGLAVKYSGGNSAKDVANYGAKKQNTVGLRAPNAFNIYDMTGNVAEWCDDWSDSSRQCKIVKGGAYNSRISPVNELLITSRSMVNPDERQPTIGFRVAWSK